VWVPSIPVFDCCTAAPPAAYHLAHWIGIFFIDKVHQQAAGRGVACCVLSWHVPDAALEFLGCFKDPATREASGACTRPASSSPITLLQSAPTKCTLQACARLVQLRNFSYAVLQNGYDCYGSNSISMYSQPGVCDVACSGNQQQQCGGLCSSAVYAVTSGATWKRQPQLTCAPTEP